MGFARKDVEATKRCEKKFVRYQEGAEKYSLGLTKFQALAKEGEYYGIDDLNDLLEALALLRKTRKGPQP